MSTNDEIRKAAQAIVNDIETLTRCWIEKDEEEKAVEIVMQSIAKHLAPHPAQQGEDSTKAILPIYDREGEAMGDGDSFVYQHGSPHEQIITIERTGGVEYLSFSSGQPRMTVADFWYARSDEKQSVKCARSHSKQEGGA